MNYSRVQEAFERILISYFSGLSSEERTKRILDAITLRNCNDLVVANNSWDYPFFHVFRKLISIDAAQAYLSSDDIWQDLKKILIEFMEQDKLLLTTHAASSIIIFVNEEVPAIKKSSHMITVDYDFNRTFGTPSRKDNRPYVEVVIYGPTGKNERLYCLLDSGADEMMIDESVATNIGINLASGTKKTITTASGGSATATLVTGIEMDIEGKRIKERCYFIKGGVQLIGRNTILAALEFGMNTKGWLGKN